MIDNWNLFEKELMSKKVLIIGSLNVDWIYSFKNEPPHEGTEEILDFKMTFGGHGGDCAVALARLGLKTFILSAVGNDHEGSLIIDDLKKESIDVSLISTVSDVITGRAIIPQSVNKQCLYVLRGANGSSQILQAIKKIDLNSFDFIVALDANLEIIDYIFSKNVNKKIPCLWNPGPLLVNDQKILKRFDFPNVLIFNELEIESICKKNSLSSTSFFEINNNLQLIITKGAKGSLFVEKNCEKHFPAWNVETQDSTGAGDAFTAGFSLMHALKYSTDISMQFGNLMGALATRKVGARCSLPNISEIKQFLNNRFLNEKI